MFPLFRARSKARGVSAFSIDERGIALATISRREGDTPVLLAHDYRELEPLDSPAETLKNMVDTHRMAKQSASLVVAPLSHSLLLIEAPDVPPAELKAAVRWRIKDLIDFHIDDAVIDVFEVPDKGAPGRAKLMYAVAARAADIRDSIDLLEGVGLEIDIIDIPELALRNIACMLPEDVQGVAMLYFGEENGVMTLTRQGSLYLSRNLDVGQAHMRPNPDDSAEEREERLHRVLDHVGLEIQRSLDYYESHFGQGAISNVAIAPMESNVPGMIPYLSGHLSIAVRLFDLNALIDIAEPMNDSAQACSLLAIGAALRHEQKLL